MTATDIDALAKKAPARTAGAPARAPRDLRLDFFRGLALIFIFINHIPENALSWFTNRYWGFSDATEIFVFVSGYTAAIAYGGIALKRGPAYAGVRVLHRVWQLYAAHIFLFVVYTAEIAYVSHSFENPVFAEEMAVMQFLRDPDVTLLQALLLKFRPVNMDVLPLYIVLLLIFPLLLTPIRRWPALTLGLSIAVYIFAYATDFNLPGYPGDARWFFNPFAWQLLFVLGAICAMHREWLQRLRRHDFILMWMAVAFLAFAAVIVQTWNFPSLESWVPRWLGRILYPIDKTDMDPLRLFHFLAMAYLAMRVMGRNSRVLRWRIAQPIIRCGQHSLHIFCLGIFLSFTGHFIVTEYIDGLSGHLLVSAVGIGLMVGLAYTMDWFKRAGAAPEGGA